MFDCDQWIVHEWVWHSYGYLHQHTLSGDSVLLKHKKRNLLLHLHSHHCIYGPLFQTWHFLFSFCVFKQKSWLKSHRKSTRHIISNVFVAFNPVACVWIEAALGEISLTTSSKPHQNTIKFFLGIPNLTNVSSVIMKLKYVSSLYFPIKIPKLNEMRKKGLGFKAVSVTVNNKRNLQAPGYWRSRQRSCTNSTRQGSDAGWILTFLLVTQWSCRMHKIQIRMWPQQISVNEGVCYFPTLLNLHKTASSNPVEGMRADFQPALYCYNVGSILQWTMLNFFCPHPSPAF